MVSVADERTGEFRPSYISIDRLTNEIVDVPANKVRIPDKIGLTPVSSAEKDILRAGLALPKEVTLKNGRKFHALLQGTPTSAMWSSCRDRKIRIRHNGWRTAGGGQNNDPSDTQQNQGNESDGKRQRRNRSWTNEDGSIRPIKKWKDDTFTEQQIKDYVAGKTVVLANAKDDQGQPCTKYLKFSFEKRASADLLAESRPCADRRPVEREQDAACREQRGQDQRGHQAREGAVAAGSDRTKGRNPAETADQEIQRHEGVLIAATKSIRQ